LRNHDNCHDTGHVSDWLVYLIGWFLKDLGMIDPANEFEFEPDRTGLYRTKVFTGQFLELI